VFLLCPRVHRREEALAREAAQEAGQAGEPAREAGQVGRPLA
jgi:hypothetical protein